MFVEVKNVMRCWSNFYFNFSSDIVSPILTLFHFYSEFLILLQVVMKIQFCSRMSPFWLLFTFMLRQLSPEQEGLMQLSLNAYGDSHAVLRCEFRSCRLDRKCFITTEGNIDKIKQEWVIEDCKIVDKNNMTHWFVDELTHARVMLVHPAVFVIALNFYSGAIHLSDK